MTCVRFFFRKGNPLPSPFGRYDLLCFPSRRPLSVGVLACLPPETIALLKHFLRSCSLSQYAVDPASGLPLPEFRHDWPRRANQILLLRNDGHYGHLGQQVTSLLRAFDYARDHGETRVRQQQR